jgi:hypothetical protein
MTTAVDKQPAARLLTVAAAGYLPTAPTPLGGTRPTPHPGFGPDPLLARAHAAERLGADRFLLAAIGSWRDPLSDEDVLRELSDWKEAPWGTPPPHLRRQA